MIMTKLQHIYYTLVNLFREDTTFGSARHKDWRKVRKEHLRLHPYCAITGSKKKRQVHHIIPFFIRPDLELEPTNLITLSGKKILGVKPHQFFGHLGNFRRYNPDIDRDSKIWYTKIISRP